jgi:hypothetical protein
MKWQIVITTNGTYPCHLSHRYSATVIKSQVIEHSSIYHFRESAVMYMCAMDIDYAYVTTLFWLSFGTVLRVFILFYHFILHFHVWYLRKEWQVKIYILCPITSKQWWRLCNVSTQRFTNQVSLEERYITWYRKYHSTSMLLKPYWQ